MTKKEIEQYIELDNKIKNRIVQISHALNDVHGANISKFVPNFKHLSLEAYDKTDFIENTQQDEKLHLGLDCYDGSSDGWVCNFYKCLLTLTDKEINKIVEYDRKQKEEYNKRKLEAEKAIKEKNKKQEEMDEYKQYLKLKKKFEKE